MINLVTGGAGFLGSNLINFLIKKGERVICLDNFSSGSDKNFSNFINDEKFSIVKHDITKSIELKVDKIWHLASPASPIKYIKNPIETAKINFLGSYNMLEIARKVKAKILLVSTSEIYGSPIEHPQKETYYGSVNTLSRRACYQEGKRMAECLFNDYLRTYDVDIKIARVFNTYGPNMNPYDGRVISSFITRGLQNKSINIFGNGNQTRSFCYVDDLINGLVKVMDHKYNQPINLGGTNEISILNLAKLIINKINPELKIIYKTLPEGDPIKRRPSIKLAEKLLSWHPIIKLDNGIDLTISNFKKTIEN